MRPVRISIQDSFELVWFQEWLQPLSCPEDAASFKIDKFKGESFHLWKFKMQMMSEDKDLWEIVSGDEVEPSGVNTT